MRSFYQGRLGTNIGKTFKWTVFSGQVQGPLDHFSWTGCVRTLRDWIAPAGFQGQFTHKGSMRSNCADWAYPCVRASVSLSHAPSRSLCVCLDASFCLSLSLSCAWYGIGGGRYPMNHSALPNGSHHASPSWVRDVPLIFNVEFDPSGT
jgi:hypothetical protein